MGNVMYVILVVVVVGGIIAFAYNGFSFGRLRESLSGESSLKSGEDSSTFSPPEWCAAQEIFVGEEWDDPVSGAVLGWDGAEGCCMKRFEGFDCALNASVVLSYCVSGDVGGKVVYVRLNNTFAEPQSLNIYVDNLDKGDYGRVCYLYDYPMEVC